MRSVWRHARSWYSSLRTSRTGRLLDAARARWATYEVGRNVAAITFYGLLSLFPLLHVADVLLGLAADVSPEVADTIGSSIDADLGSLGQGSTDTVARDIGTGGVVAAVLGVPLALWSASRAFAALFAANDDIWGVPAADRLTGPRRRLASLKGVGLFAVRAVVLAAAVTVVRFAADGVVAAVAVFAVEFAVNVWLAFGLLRLGSTRRTWAELWPAVVVSAVGFAGLQVWGAVLARDWSAEATGDHASTVGLLAVMWGHVLVLLGSASMVSLRVSLSGRDDPPADEGAGPVDPGT